MELACNDVVPGLGCDFVAHGAISGEVHGAMLEHGGVVHASLLDGLSAEVAGQKKNEMDAHIRQLIAANN